MNQDEPDTETLLRAAEQGDSSARHRLLQRDRARLRQMVAVRLDPRIAARLDPSDVVQEALADASKKLDDYLAERPLPFYPWLRRLAGERLTQAYRRHLKSSKRDAGREVQIGRAMANSSIAHLTDRLTASGTSPSEHLLRDERRRQLRSALEVLPENDRDVLVMRYLEQLRFNEIAAVLGISEGAVKVRHFRALERLRGLLGPFDEGLPR